MRPEPGMPGPGQVLLEVLECGICGTDRGILASSHPLLPRGQKDLVMGHEPLARVLAVGAEVRHLAPGDLATATNQRSCGACEACLGGDADLCLETAGNGRGVGGMDGFLQPRLLDDAAWCVRVPSSLESVAVLTEPLAVGEKALLALRHAQRRLGYSRWSLRAGMEDWAAGLRFGVGGAGPVGLLAALALRCHGADVAIFDRAPSEGAKARAASSMGAVYVCTADMDTRALRDAVGHLDAVVEASGSAELAVALWRALGANGALVLIGWPGGPHPEMHPQALLGQALARNQVLVGTLASNPRHFQQALDDLALARLRFPHALEQFITARWDTARAMESWDWADHEAIKRVIRLAAR